MSERRSWLDEIDDRWLKQLATAEARVMALVADEYAKATRQLLPEWMVISRTLERAREEGYDDAYLAGAIWHEQRIAGAMVHTVERYQQLATYTHDQLTPELLMARELGAESVLGNIASQLLDENDLPLLRFVFPRAAFETFLGRLETGTPLDQLLRDRFGLTAGIVREELVKGVTLGWGPNQIRASIQQRVGGHYGRIDVLVRTELLGVYRKSMSDTFKANRHLLRGWRWSAAMSPRTCPVCWAMHGTEHPIDEPMESHPACRCSMRPIVRPWEEISPLLRGIQAPPQPTGVDLFRQLPPQSQRQVLGPRAFAAYRQGFIDLPDLVQQTWSPVWGGGRKQRALVSVIGPDRMRKLDDKQ